MPVLGNVVWPSPGLLKQRRCFHEEWNMRTCAGVWGVSAVSRSGEKGPHGLREVDCIVNICDLPLP